MIIDSGVATGSLQVSGSLLVTGSTSLSGDITITGSLKVDGSISGAITGSITDAVSASYAESASYAVSASFASTAISAPFYVLTASYNTDSSSLSTRTTNLEATASTLTSASSSFVNQLDGIAGKTGSYATTGSNTFTGTQYTSNSTNATSFTSTAALYTDGGARITKDLYVSGTTYLNNLTVFGSASVQYVTSSTLVGLEFINLNTDLPALRYAGINVADSGSGAGLSSSYWYDSEKDNWLYVYTPAGSAQQTSSIAINGPITYNNLGNEAGLTGNYLTKGQAGLGVGNDHHITSSQIFDDGTTVAISGSLQVTGSFRAANLTGSLFGTASQAISASFAQTASFVTLAQTASFVTLAQTASFVTLAQTASSVAILRQDVVISGSLTLSGSFGSTPTEFAVFGDTSLSGSINISGSTILRGTTVMSGSLTLSGSVGSTPTELTVIGDTVLSGSTIITGSTRITGSAFGNIVAVNVINNTASLDFSQGNYFTVNLTASVITAITSSNIPQGVSAVLRVTQPATSGSVRLDSAMFKQPSGSFYTGSAVASAVDIVSFTSFTAGTAFAVASSRFI